MRKITRRQKLALGILASILVAIPAVAVASSTFFVETVSASIHSAPVLTLVSVTSSGINAGISGCTGLPAGSDGSSAVSVTCALDATRGNSGTVTVTLKSNYPINSVSVTASGPSADFTISNPGPQAVGTGGTAFMVGLSIPIAAPDSSATLTISIAA